MTVGGTNALELDRRQALTLLGSAALWQASPAFATGSGPRLAWFEAAKFGLFVHWGPYSLASVEASYPLMGQAAKWKISEERYRALPAGFNPSAFDPDQIIDLARAAGQRYIVFTAKHHDGFCMFDSAYTDYKITRTPYRRDAFKLLAEACARRNMPLGFYYSPPDMHHPGFRDISKPSADNWNGEPTLPGWPGYLDYMELQLRELLTRYGDIKIVWFDGLAHQEKYDGRRFVDLVSRLQPGALVNDRIGVPGDFVTPEQFIPRGIPTRGIRFDGIDRRVEAQLRSGLPSAADFQPWESCLTINDTWAFNANDLHFKSPRELIRSLVEVTSRGGNFLLNIGPQPDGRVQPEFQERLRAIGRWMAVNGEAVHGATFGPVQGEATYRTTQRGDAVYVHIFDWPEGSLRIAPLSRPVRGARLLAGGVPLEVVNDAHGTGIALPVETPHPDVSVVRLDLS